MMVGVIFVPDAGLLQIQQLSNSSALNMLKFMYTH